MKFRETVFWKHYLEYQAVIKESRMRSTVDAVLLWKVCQYYQFKSLLEIGVHQGLTLGLLLQANPGATVTGIDPRPQLELLHQHYQNDLPRVNIVVDCSQNVAFDKSFDFVLIDGDKSYHGMMSDVVKSTQHLSSQGVLAISYNRSLQDPKQVEIDLLGSGQGWVPFLQSEQIMYWHREHNDRSNFLDSLFDDPISEFIFVRNEPCELGPTVVMAKTVAMLTNHVNYFDMALQHYDI